MRQAPVSLNLVRQAVRLVPFSLNFIYVSKVITWASYVSFMHIIYHFKAYDETNQIQNHILHKICGFMSDKHMFHCLLHINAVCLCETCTCPTACLTCSGLYFLPDFYVFSIIFQLKLSALTNHIVL